MFDIISIIIYVNFMNVQNPEYSGGVLPNFQHSKKRSYFYSKLRF